MTSFVDEGRWAQVFFRALEGVGGDARSNIKLRF